MMEVSVRPRRSTGSFCLEIVLVGFVDHLQQRALARAVHVDQRLVDVPEDERGGHE